MKLVFKTEKSNCVKAASGIQSKCPAQQKSSNCRSDPEHRCPVFFFSVWTLIKDFDINTFWDINSRLPVQGSCSSTAWVVEELLIAYSLCQCFGWESTEKLKSQRRVESEQRLASISRRNLIRLSRALSTHGVSSSLAFPIEQLHNKYAGK